MANAQQADSTTVKTDSLKINNTIFTPYQLVVKNIIDNNQYLSTQKTPQYNIVSFKKTVNNAFPFYLLLAIVGFLATVKFLYARYFATLFKVFFNATLKQNQLTHQLLQSKLPSLLYNILFVIVASVYIYTLSNHYGLKTTFSNKVLIIFSILVIAIIYLTKYSTLKLVGWLTGNISITNSYTFIIFLINKIIGVILIPLIVAINFAKPAIANSAVIISFLVLGFMFLLRFFKSYGALLHKLKVSRLHFFLYLIGVEVLPLLVCYKLLVLFLGKNM